MGHIIKFFRSYIFCGFYLLTVRGKVNRMAKHPEKYTLEQRYSFAQKIVRKLLKKLKVSIEVSGLEYIESNPKSLIIPNHRSLLDCLVLVAVCDTPLSFVAKDEAQDIIVIGKLTKLLDTLYLQRNNLRQSMQIMKEVANRLNDNKAVVIFPEGTRNRTNQPIQEFKAGAFKGAIESQASIVPVILRGTDVILSSKVKKNYKVNIEILENVNYEDYKDLSSVELSTQLHLLMEEQYKNPTKL